MRHETVPSITSTEDSVRKRYALAAQQREEALCCPVNYTADFLAVIPQEILERDYGCGDPTRYVREGETVVDLGSGGGKLCYILAQIVGPDGQVIGVDCNQEMLGLARRFQKQVADRLGYDNVSFHQALIQDLRLDLDVLSRELVRHPVQDAESWLGLRNLEERLRCEHPMIADDSVDCVVSNCVLNLVREAERHRLFSEMFRVLRRGGRVVISDIVADEDVPPSLKDDPQLWSGCISGAFREDQFLAAFEAAGFHGLEIAARQPDPWRTVAGIEFRSITIVAHKGKQGPCWERNQAVIYRGPFRKVEDDDGHVYVRGARTAVCDKTFHLLQAAPYNGQFEPIEPREPIPLPHAKPFDGRRSRLRDPRETKGSDYTATTESDGPQRCDGQACC